jgi:radical SAM protein with 4Fe4S-binding SPASM domain
MTPTRDGKGIMFVAHNGEVYPSGFLPISAGKLPQDNLGTIYGSNPLFIALRDPSRLKGRCGRCEYREICGGSRSRAFAESGDPLEEDPACIYVPNTDQAAAHSVVTELS